MFSTTCRKLRFATISLAALVLAIYLALWPQHIFAATNTAFDPGGGTYNLQPSGPVTVNSIQLALVKQARDLSGTVLPDGTIVSPGQEIYFLLYVDNPTTVSAVNIQFTDLLNESQFTYVPGTIESTVVPTGSNDPAIWSGVWTAVTDDLGAPDDLASFVDTGGPTDRDRFTVGSVSGQANQVLNVNGSTLRAFRFRVKVK